jgi:hypothetical protein
VDLSALFVCRQVGVAVALCALLIGNRVATAGTLQVLVDRTTGQTFLQNSGAGDAIFTFYSLKSPTLSARFVPGNWLSITDNYDSDSGVIKVDPNTPWLEIAGSSAELSEGSSSSFGQATLLEGQSLNLGNVFLTSAQRDIVATYADQFDNSQAAPVFYRLNAADYNRDGLVNTDDYNVWSSTFGSTIDPRADGNLNGEIDAGDYNVWRDIFIAPAAIGFAAASIPEPTGIALVVATLGVFVSRRIRRLAATR